jgi:hypothetical protein
MKAAEYGTHTNATAAFVSTNSICQGQQVPILWLQIFATGHQIYFAHTSFKWSNLASHNAGVTVVIVCIGRSPAPRRLFSLSDDGEQVVQSVSNINAYLVAGPNIVVQERQAPPAGRREIEAGGKPVDGGNLLLSALEKEKLSRYSPIATRYLKRVFGANEHNKGLVRYTLWITNADIDIVMQDEYLRWRSRDAPCQHEASTVESANWPHRFQEVKQTGLEVVTLVPTLTSERRTFIPVGLEPPGTIITNLSFSQFDGSMPDLAILNSRLHFIWVATVCGKFKTDYRYSNTLGWNTFPVPRSQKRTRLT